jgi:hypothetical protein
MDLYSVATGEAPTMRRLLIAALAAAAMVAACAPATASPTPAPTTTPVETVAPTATPTVTPVPTATPAETPTPASTATPAPTTTPAPTKFTTGVPGALAFVKEYEDGLLAGQYTKAWAMLAPGSQKHLTSVADYTSERKAYLASAGKAYTEEANPPSSMSMSDWLSGMDFAPSIDQPNAVLVQVTWTALANNNAGWEMWIVNPTVNGWELYEVR